MSIERHRLQREKNAGAYMEPAPDGNWVTFADHAAELARVEAANALLRAECEACRNFDKVVADTFPGQPQRYDAANKVHAARAATDAAGILKGGE